MVKPWLLEAIAKTLGVPYEGQAKTFIYFVDKHGHGAFKMLMVEPANSIELALLNKLGVDMVGDKSVMKLMGNREFGKKYTMPIEAIQVQRTGTNDVVPGEQPMLRQFVQMMYQVQSPEFWNELKESSKRIRFELDEIQSAFNRKDFDTFYSKMNKLLERAMNTPTIDEIENTIEKSPHYGVASEILHKVGIDIHMFNHPAISKYANQVIRNYIVSEIIRPKYPGFLAYFSGKPASIVRKFPLMKGIDHNNIVLGKDNNASLSKKTWLKILDNAIELGTPEEKKFLRTYIKPKIKALGNDELKPLSWWFNIQELRAAPIPIPVVVARSPISNKGGVAVAKIVGIAEGGGRQVFASKKMFNKLGGADSDADEMGIWFGRPNSYLKEIEKNWDYIYNELSTIDDKIKKKIE